MSHSTEFCSHNPSCCFSTSNTEGKRIFRYRLSPETFGYTFSNAAVRLILPWAPGVYWCLPLSSSARVVLQRISNFDCGSHPALPLTFICLQGVFRCVYMD